MNVLAVIPARGGSKGVPKKNIRMLNGRPLIGYTIDAANESKLLTDVVVSTDDEGIRNIALDLGGNVPFIRPEELATDTALSAPVVEHALNFMEEFTGKCYQGVMMLQPTSPFRTGIHIDNAIREWLKSGADSLVSVTSVSGYHPFRMKRLVKDSRVVNYIDQGFEDMRPRQILPEVYIRSGSIYLSSVESFRSSKSLLSSDCAAIVMDEKESINIDSEVDFAIAEYFMACE